EADHQDLARPDVLHHGRHQPGRVEADLRRRVFAHAGTRGGRTGTPAAASARLASGMRIVPKWKMLAAIAASAPPSTSAARRCSMLPAPPLATTGTLTASAMARVNWSS